MNVHVKLCEQILDVVVASQAARRDKRRAGGETCEHGVHRCRICFPIDAHK